MKVAASIAALVIAAAALPAQAGQLLLNGGFETGTASGWTISGTNNGGCGQNFNVSDSGMASGCTGWAPIPAGFVNPNSGHFAAYAAFDGSGPLNHTITQTFSLAGNFNKATVSWYDALGLGAGWSYPQAREYTVSLLNSQGVVVADLMTESYSHGGVFQGWTQHTKDISAFLPGLGKSASLRFNLHVPQSFTGPAAFGLDDVSVNASAVPEPASLALLGLGLLGLGMVRRQRKS